MNTQQLVLGAENESSQEALGAQLAAAARPGLVVFLQGGLGLGKTTFARGFMRAMGHAGAVKSPTYTLVEPYLLGGRQIYHFDLYRLADPEELEFMGIRDYFSGESICLLEWPERGQGVLPPADLVINIERKGAGRSLTLRALSRPGAAVLAQMALQPAPENQKITDET